MDVLITSHEAILQNLGEQGRYVLVPWRALIILRNATIALSPDDRRWAKMPTNAGDLRPTFRSMQEHGQIKMLTRSPRAYQVTTPYARKSSPDPMELLLELNPYGVISHASALTFHGLSLDLPEFITAMTPTTGKTDLFPVGTEPRDWEGLDRPTGYAISKVLGVPVSWQRARIEHFFGIETYRLGDVPIRVTTPERTLVEGLRNPEICGGISNVLRSWERARWMMDVDAVVSTVERFDTGILRQRVGYVLESLGIVHPELEGWQRHAQRGGSSKLFGSEPFASVYSERWQMSLNGPVALLKGDDDGI